MLLGRPIASDLGLSLNPFHYVKKAAVGVEHGAVASGKFVASHAKGIAELAVLPVVVLNKVVAGPILHAALTPVRHKVDQLKDRRAKKLAWDRRKSTTPTPAEQNEAKSWAKSTLRHEKIPFGPILSLLAGPRPAPMLFGRVELGSLGDPTTATIISSIPVLLEIMKSVLSKNSNNGQAPANAAGGAAAPAAPGVVDLTPAQDAAAAAAGGDDGSAGGDAGGGAGGKKHGKGGGGGGQILGLPKKYVIIGGAVLGGVLVLSLLTSKKG